MNTITCNIIDYNTDWENTKDFMNIRTKGTYQNVQHHKHPKHLVDFRLFNQHKPYGMSTPSPDPYDDRPDWMLFMSKPKRRYYEEIMHNDPEFPDAMSQDHDMNISHHHVHIKPVQPDTSNEEIGSTVEI